MGTRVSYPYEVKMKAIEMRLAGVPIKQILTDLNIRHKTQVETWMRWYRNGEMNRLKQPVGKQYIFNKGPESDNEQTRLALKNRFLKQQIEVLKKYAELERKWLEK